MSENINFEFKKTGKVTIFRLNENRFDSQIAGLVKGELTILLHTDDVKHLIIDLSQVEYCDSSGLSAILLAFRIQQNKLYLLLFHLIRFVINLNVKSMLSFLHKITYEVISI